MTKTGLEKLIEDLVAEQEYWNGRNSSVADRIGRLLHIARSLLADEQVQKPLINASLVEELKYYCKTSYDDGRVSTVPYAIGRATAKKEILNILSKYTPVSAEPVETPAIIQRIENLREIANELVGETGKVDANDIGSRVSVQVEKLAAELYVHEK